MSSLPNVVTHLLVPLALALAAGWFSATYGVAEAWWITALALWALYLHGVARRQQRQFRRAVDLIRPHARALAIRRSQTIRTDAYGMPVATGWEKERQTFFDRVIAPHFSSLTAFQRLDLLQEIERLAQFPMLVSAAAPADPVEYEQFCAAILERHGWTARRTKATGDQGVDIIAERSGLKVVLQCKLYGRPVGNGAVQEAIAGAQFERARIAVVVSNAAFTAAAQQLATTAGVLLLHHEQLPMLAELVVATVSRTGQS